MTENEAIEWLNGFYNADCEREDFEATICADCNFPCRYGEPVLMAIDALKEIQQYRALGTVEDIKRIIAFLSFDGENNLINDLNLLNQYRMLGTVEQLREEMEK